MIDLKNAGAVLTVDLNAVKQNFLRVKKVLKENTDCAVAVKTDSYGLGANKIAPELASVGCKHFFVAHIFEGEALRKHLKDEKIYVLHGVPLGCEETFLQNNLIPVLNNYEQIAIWQNFANKINQKLDAVIHVDTGMVRLGVSLKDLDHIVSDENILADINPVMLMSHLACADDVHNPKNSEQLKLFLEAKTMFSKKYPNAIYSFANSAAINLGEEYHFDLVRPGIAIYGGGYLQIGNSKEPMNRVVKLEGKILQIQEADYPQTVGYGATWQASSKRKIATVSIGYGDGLTRAFSNKLKAFIEDIPISCVGRLSMDLMTFDVTNVSINDCYVGKFVEIIGKNNSIGEVAAIVGTIDYEIITSLGKRYCRQYLD